jgi:D-alanyl-D-alanine carboxypeptidase/D-alanyl-D-alanine-endopeptidase (penicillin-binding protein 4)
MPDHLLPVVGFPVPVTFRSILQRTVLPLGLLAATAFSGLSAQPGTKIEGMPGLPRTSGRSSVAALSRDIDAILADRSFADATWGISIVSCESGESIYRLNDGKNQQVASNIKLLTTAAALRKLGSEYRFRTDIYINGEITPAGDLIGDLVIKAGGDPSIAPEFGIDPREVLQTWAHLLDTLGVRTIQNVVVDASLFDDIPSASGWAWDDEPFGFNAPISAAAIYGNSIEVTVTPGTAPGRPVQINVSPSTAYVALRVSAVTSRSDSASTLDVTRERGSSIIHVSGNIAAGSEPFTEHISIEDPPLFVASLMKEELERIGIKVHGSAFNADHYDRIRELLALRKIGSYYSPPLKSIVAATNKQSINLAAEMMLKKLGREFARVGTTAAGLEVVKGFLSQTGIDVDHIRLYDGSGLSRQDFISPGDITMLLSWIHHSTLSRDFMASLAIAGQDGTLANRMKRTLAENNVLGKTGYLGSVRAISGYARTRDGEWMAYSIVTDNYSVPTGVVNAAQDLILMRLASFSRRS